MINQTWNNIEIIIIDDGSKDRTQEIVKEYSIHDKRIKYYLQDNSGPSIARNNGMSKANGEYIAFCDADDNVSSLYIEKLVKEAQQYNCDIVTCGYIDISKYGQVQCNDFYVNKANLEKYNFIDCIFNGVGGTVWGKLFKRKIIIENNIKMNPDIFMCEDMIFVLEYALKSVKFGALKEYLYNYNRLNEKSISSNLNLNYYNSLNLVIEKIEEILDNNGFKKLYIDKILSERVKNLSSIFLIGQHSNKHNYSKREKMNNIKRIMDNKYFKKYKIYFTGNSFQEKIIIYLINKNQFEILNIYTRIVYEKQRLKDIIKGIS